GRWRKATEPASSRAAVKSEVATGRRMNGAEMLETPRSRMLGLRRRVLHAPRRGAAPEAVAEPIEGQVYHRRGVQGQDLAENQAADDADAERAAELRTGAGAERQRDAAHHGGQRGHQDGAEAQQAGLVDGLPRRFAVLALGLEREVNHHDGVLLHNADEQDEADEGD